MLRDGSKAFVRHHETKQVVADDFRLWGIAILSGGRTAVKTWCEDGTSIARECESQYDIISMYPNTRIINGFEVSAPEVVEPKIGDTYFNSDILSEEFYDSFAWRDDGYDKLNLARGLVFLNKEDAIANAKAMLGINPHEESE